MGLGDSVFAEQEFPQPQGCVCLTTRILDSSVNISALVIPMDCSSWLLPRFPDLPQIEISAGETVFIPKHLEHFDSLITALLRFSVFTPFVVQIPQFAINRRNIFDQVMLL